MKETGSLVRKYFGQLLVLIWSFWIHKNYTSFVPHGFHKRLTFLFCGCVVGAWYGLGCLGLYIIWYNNREKLSCGMMNTIKAKGYN